MKRLLGVLLAICFCTSLVSATVVEDVQAYAGNQPINREMLDRVQTPNTQLSQTDYLYNDPYLSYQWAITQTSADLAWDVMEQEASIVVAVVDSGVDYTHEDLENRVLVELGYDFVNDDDDPMDDNGHGTHVSGIIAAEADNGVGIAGMVGALDVSILPVKVLDADGAGETADIAAGILYAVDKEVDIINLSLGADVITPDVRQAIETALEADIFVVVASGNDGTVCAPLSLANLDGVFTVAAATESDTVADFSNYGDCIDAYAPGEDILSTYLNNQYAYQDGTSMAAPIVTGAAAILLAQNPDLTNAELTALLSNTQTTTQTTQETNQQTTQQTTQQTNQQTNQQNQIVVQYPVVVTPVTPISTPGMWAKAVMPGMMTTPTTTTQTCQVVNVYEALLQV